MVRVTELAESEKGKKKKKTNIKKNANEAVSIDSLLSAIICYKILYGVLFYWRSAHHGEKRASVGYITAPFTCEYLYLVSVQLRALRTSEERHGALRQWQFVPAETSVVRWQIECYHAKQ